MADVEAVNPPDYGTSRFEGSGQSAPQIIRTLDGHRVMPKTPREDADLDVEVTGNWHDCEY